MAFTATMSRTSDDLSGITGAQHTQVLGESVVVEPADTNAVADIVRYAQRQRLSVGVRGGGTKQLWARGETPRICISLNRLNRLIEHPWQDLTCTVQAGCRWDALQSALAQHGQFVALDPLFRNRATIGGILATNDSGPLRQRYGSLRDFVIGMTLVLADGKIVKTGGKVVKNVAGYDLCKLMTGSYGTLAIITEATFRLHSLPQHAHSFTVVAKDTVRIASLIAAVRSSHLLAQSLQIRRSRSGCYLDICLNVHPLAEQDRFFEQLVNREGLEMNEVSKEVWNARESLFSEDATVLRVATLPVDVCRYLDTLPASTAAIELNSVSQAIGLHDVALRGARDEVKAWIQKLRADAAASNITLSVLQPGIVERLPAFDIPAPVLSLMQAVKRQFDPNNILNPGRFFTGT